MSSHLIFAQVNPDMPLTTWGMIVDGGISTQIIMGILLIFSLMSWALIVWKYFAFRKLWSQAGGFLDHMEKATRLEEAYRSILSLPESPFTRVFRRGVNFFSELRPGALREGVTVAGLSIAQLEVLRLVLEKEEGEERDEAAHGLQWLAVIATVSPLLGLPLALIEAMFAAKPIVASAVGTCVCVPTTAATRPSST